MPFGILQSISTQLTVIELVAGVRDIDELSKLVHVIGVVCAKESGMINITIETTIANIIIFMYIPLTELFRKFIYLK